MLRPFMLHRPATAAEACDLLAAHGDEAMPYAGGTELLLIMKMGLARPRHLVDVKRLPGFDAIRMDGGELVIGAAVTHRTVEHSPLVRERAPLLARVARHVANVRVRNVGTVGGNVAFADPHSDVATMLTALDAAVELVSRRGRRAVPLTDFVRGPYETVREPDELVAGVRFTPWPAGTVQTYVKFGTHERPTLGIAVCLTSGAATGTPGAHSRGTGSGRSPDDRSATTGRGEPEISGARDRLRADNRTGAGDLSGARADVRDGRRARLAIGCVNAKPERVAAAEARLGGADAADVESIGADVAALAAGCVDAVDDLHGSGEYKREMVAVFTRRALAAAAGRARGIERAAHYPYTIVV